MYIVGQEEIDALTRVIQSGALFRYGVGSECDRFEARYAKYLGCKHFALAASGSNALAAAMIGVGLGPGDEVLIPAHTYMATATSVLAVGAIPVIVDIDETLTIDPAAVEAAIGPRTQAVVPVHMWGTACDMERDHGDRRAAQADRHRGRLPGRRRRLRGPQVRHHRSHRLLQLQLLQEHDGGRGRRRRRQRRRASPSARAAPSTLVTSTGTAATTPCKPFAGNGARASELMGAMLNVQLDRLDGMVAAMRAERKAILAGTASLDNLGLAAGADEQPRPRLRHAGVVHAALGRSGGPFRRRSSRASSPARPAATPTPNGTRC